MAKKPELLKQAEEMGLAVTSSNTIAQIEAAIKAAQAPKKAAAKEEKAEEKTDERHYAKSGKRSEKVERETVEKLEKEARKEAGDTTPQDDADEAHVKKGPKPITRSRLDRRSKTYRKLAEQVETGKTYALSEALELATKTSPVKFDASVEVHVRLGVDPRQADQNVRATVSLPNGTGKTIRVAVFAPEADHAGAKKAGADIIGDEEFLKQLDREELNFDTLIATPQYMPRLGKYARLLGPRGLMPNPKAGTVATDVAKAVAEAKAGKVEYRVDKQAIIHLSIGKVSFGPTKLEENARTFFASLQSQKPSSLKSVFVKSTAISTTMGPGIKVENVAN